METEKRRPSMPAIFIHQDRTNSHHIEYKGRLHQEQLQNQKRKHIFGEHYNYNYHYHKPIVSGRQRIQENRSLEIEKSNLKLLEKIQTIFKRTSISKKHKLQPINIETNITKSNLTNINIVNTSRANPNASTKMNMFQKKESISKIHEHQNRSISSIEYQSTPNHNALEILKTENNFAIFEKGYDVKKNGEFNLRLTKTKEMCKNGDQFKRCQTEMHNKSYTYPEKEQELQLNKQQSLEHKITVKINHEVKKSREENLNKKQNPNPEVPNIVSPDGKQISAETIKTCFELNSNIISIQILSELDNSSKMGLKVEKSESLEDEEYSMEFESCESSKQLNND